VNISFAHSSESKRQQARPVKAQASGQSDAQLLEQKAARIDTKYEGNQ
jgi:hypothetical protein